VPVTGLITDIRATSVTVPLEAPIRHAHGAHWGRFVRTIVEVETDEGLVGLGEMGGGGESAEAAVAAMKSCLLTRSSTKSLAATPTTRPWAPRMVLDGTQPQVRRAEGEGAPRNRTRDRHLDMMSRPHLT
jgi:L-alanine-DL-glutamate epimerase-like enolase superfamily enzyme